MHYVTTPRPHVDRCATAWLLKRFVDPDATFHFGAGPPGAVPFDVPGAKLGHRGGGCTFETALEDHGLDDPALRALAALVHDLDMHEMALPESAGLDAILQGLRLAEPDDHKVLERASLVFDALYARAKSRQAG